MRGQTPGAVAIASWLFSAVLLTALWAYALQRRLGSANYWRVVFWIVATATVGMLAPILLAGGPAARLAAWLTLPVVPAYVAAWRYAYRSTELWSSPT